MKRKHPFNMIEIMLALGVCVIGVCSIMVLFPVGTSATRDAAMETYAAHAADQMLHMLKYQMIQPPSPPPPAIPTTNPWTDAVSSSGTLPDTYSAAVTSNKDIAPDDTNWTVDADMNNVFSHEVGGVPTEGVYKVISQRGTDVDFNAIMFVWWSPISMLVSGSNKNEDVGVTLNVEVTWPAELPYDRRQKANYSLEVFNPN